MKRIVLAAAALVISSTTAQSVNDQPRPVGATRVAVVNMGAVFSSYEKAIRYRKALGDLIGLSNEETQELIENMKAWQAAIAKKDFGAFSKEDYEEKLTNANKELESLARKAKSLIQKKREKELVTLWKEIKAEIAIHAKAHSLQLVLGYGDVMDKTILDRLPNVNRKMESLDKGGTVPLFFAPHVDISEAVLRTLNEKFRNKNKDD